MSNIIQFLTYLREEEVSLFRSYFIVISDLQNVFFLYFVSIKFYFHIFYPFFCFSFSNSYAFLTLVFTLPITTWQSLIQASKHPISSQSNRNNTPPNSIHNNLSLTPNNLASETPKMNIST